MDNISNINRTTYQNTSNVRTNSASKTSWVNNISNRNTDHRQMNKAAYSLFISERSLEKLALYENMEVAINDSDALSYTSNLQIITKPY